MSGNAKKDDDDDDDGSQRTVSLKGKENLGYYARCVRTKDDEQGTDRHFNDYDSFGLSSTNLCRGLSFLVTYGGRRK